MQKRGKERSSFWLGNVVLLALGGILTLGIVWNVNRDPATINLKLGEVEQILKDPNVVFQNVRYVGRSELRGQVVTHDALSDGRDNADQPQTVEWRTTLREYDAHSLQPLLAEHAGGSWEVNEEDSSLRGLTSMIFTAIMLLLVVGAAFLVARWLAGGPSPLTFGRSRHKVYAQKDLKITFADVAGIDEAVAELREVVDFLSKPEKYQALGGRIPKGVLLVGPPGTGKTLLAKAVAGEAEVPFFSMSGSDFVEMFVGVGAARVRDLFSQAENKAPCIIFIDELDALGKTRSGSINSHDEREQTLNQLLVEMDGFASNRGVIIMAATNRPEMLDPALLRPGRFDRTVVVDRPDILGREAILKVHVRHVRLGPDVDLKHVARLTPGSVGADLANLVNEAALMAAREAKTLVGMAELNEAIERMAVGLERKSRIMHEDEKQRIAYHEAGHAVVSCALPNSDPVHKVSIIPRGVGALGYVLSRPDDDRYTMTKSQLETKIKIALGGTLAEELIFGEICTGATSDLEKVSNIARGMVKEFGMSPLGRIFFPEQDGNGFLGGSGRLDGPRDYSEQTACAIDQEVRRIIDAATEEVRALLRSRRAVLEAVARKLIEDEVLDGDELRRMIAALPPNPLAVPAHVNGTTAPLAIEGKNGG